MDLLHLVIFYCRMIIVILVLIEIKKALEFFKHSCLLFNYVIPYVYASLLTSMATHWDYWIAQTNGKSAPLSYLSLLPDSFMFEMFSVCCEIHKMWFVIKFLPHMFPYFGQ